MCSLSIGTIPDRRPGLFEPQTIFECIEISLGVCSINDSNFYELTTSNFKANILDRLFALFLPDENDRKLQVTYLYDFLIV